jgi:predicted dehydrogenase
MIEPTTRREFLIGAGAATAMTACSYARTIGANDRIRLGVIGPGQRGLNRMMTAKELGADIVALADANQGLLRQAQSRAGVADKDAYADYHDLLAREDIDGVINATPDHLHRNVILDTVAAGKDLYTEKPLARTIAEGEEIVRAVEASDRIVQVGNQRRSGEHFARAREVIASGAIGEIRFVRIWDFRYRPVDPYIERAKDASLFAPELVDWERFLGPAPRRAYDPKRASAWRWFWDYAGGLMTDIGPHWLDVAMWLTGADGPNSVTCNGGNYQSPDWETPDNVHAIIDCGSFAIVFMVQFMNGQEYDGGAFYGLEGSIIQENDKGKIVHYDADRKIVDSWDVGDEGTAHMRNFLDSMRSRRAPHSPVALAHRVLIGAHLANESWHSSRRVGWDPKAMRRV